MLGCKKNPKQSKPNKGPHIYFVRMCVQSQEKTGSCKGYISTGTRSAHLQTVETVVYRQNWWRTTDWTKARRIRLRAVGAPNRQEPDGKKYATCILALTVFCSALFGVCTRCANIIFTPDSTDRCTEFVVKVQINSSHWSNMGEASVGECSDSHLLSGIESLWLIQDMKMGKKKKQPKKLKQQQQNNQSSLLLLPKTKNHEMI